MDDVAEQRRKLLMGETPPVDSNGAAIDEILRQLEVDLFEVVGDEFAPKQENGSPERKRLLGLLSQSYPIFAEAKQAILAILAQEVNKKRLEGFKAGQEDIINHYHHDAEIRRAVQAATIAATTKDRKAGLV